MLCADRCYTARQIGPAAGRKGSSSRARQSQSGFELRDPRVRRACVRRAWRGVLRAGLLIVWRLQDIVLLRGLCARINDLVSAPPTRIAHTIALRLHDYCAIYGPPPPPLVHAIHHTILVMAISCKGQLIVECALRGSVIPDPQARLRVEVGVKRMRQRRPDWV